MIKIYFKDEFQNIQLLSAETEEKAFVLVKHESHKNMTIEELEYEKQ